MSIEMKKVWFDGKKMVTQNIPESDIYKRHWDIASCKAYAQQLRDKNRANTAEHAAEAIEYLLTLTQPEQEPVAVYGYCPECGAKGVMRERRPNGNDKCANGHTYPSSKSTPPQPEQEPVAWMDDYNACKCSDNETRCFSDRVFRMMQKYTAPPQRTWVGLTDEELSILGESFTHPDEGIDEVDFGMEIQRILKEKNNT